MKDNNYRNWFFEEPITNNDVSKVQCITRPDHSRLAFIPSVPTCWSDLHATFFILESSERLIKCMAEFWKGWIELAIRRRIVFLYSNCIFLCSARSGRPVALLCLYTKATTVDSGLWVWIIYYCKIQTLITSVQQTNWVHGIYSPPPFPNVKSLHCITCLTILLRHKLQTKQQHVTCLEIIKSRDIFIARGIAWNRISHKTFLLQEALHEIESGFTFRK